MPAHNISYYFREDITSTEEYVSVNITKTVMNFFSAGFERTIQRIYSMEIRPFIDSYGSATGVISMYAGESVIASKKLGEVNIDISYGRNQKGIPVNLVNGYIDLIKTEPHLTVNFTGTIGDVRESGHNIRFRVVGCASDTEESKLRHFSTTFNVNTATGTPQTVPINIPNAKVYIEAIRFNRASSFSSDNYLEFDVFSQTNVDCGDVSLSGNEIYKYNIGGPNDSLSTGPNKIKGSDYITINNISKSGDDYNGTINLDIWYTLCDLVDVYDGSQWTPHTIYYYNVTPSTWGFKLCSAYRYNGSEFVECSTNDLTQT